MSLQFMWLKIKKFAKCLQMNILYFKTFVLFFRICLDQSAVGFTMNIACMYACKARIFLILKGVFVKIKKKNEIFLFSFTF